MNVKQIVFFNIMFSVYVSIFLTLFMTLIFVGFNEMFLEEYIYGLKVAILVSMPLGFIISPVLEKLILRGEITKIKVLLFNLVLGFVIAGGVTFFIIYLKAGIFPDFMGKWEELWAVAFAIAFVMIQFSAHAFQEFTKKIIQSS